MNHPAEAPSRVVRLMVWGSAALVVIGAVAFYYATQSAQQRKPTADRGAFITITGQGCEPNAIAVPAGRTVFKITNESQRVVEWEILDGVMVVEERENIAPGFTQVLTARLEPGTYAVTCGLLGNPRGSLLVNPSEHAAGAVVRPSQRDYIGPLAQYRVYLMTQARKLGEAVAILAEAITAGDVSRAREVYAPSRLAYMHIRPVAAMFSDLSERIDGRADYLAKRESDEAFSGFHRIEYGLFKQQSTNDLVVVAKQLVIDVATLQTRIRALKVAPENLAGAAARTMRLSADLALNGGGNRYSHTGLSDLQGAIQGVTTVIDLLRPLLERVDGALAERIDADINTLDRTLSQYRQPSGFIAYDQLQDNQRNALATQFAALADDMGQINTALGLE